MMTRSIPSEFDIDFEARRATLVRRRFLWMCGVRIFFAVLGAITFLLLRNWNAGFAPADKARGFVSLFNLAMFVTAGVYAWRSPPHPRAGVERMLARCSGEGCPPRDWPAAILRGVFDHRQAPAVDDTLIAVLYRPIDAPAPRESHVQEQVPQTV
jgi:hypothetical protein